MTMKLSDSLREAPSTVFHVWLQMTSFLTLIAFGSSRVCLLTMAMAFLFLGSASASWEEWWTYDGISGEWLSRLCTPLQRDCKSKTL